MADIMNSTLEEMKRKTRRELIHYVIVLVGIIFLIEIGFMVQNLLLGTMQRTLGDYAFRFIFIPTVWDIVMCAVMYLTDRSKRPMENAKQHIIIFAMSGICAVVSAIHAYFIPMQCVFAAVIIGAALIGTRRLIIFAYLISLIFLFCTIPMSVFFNQSVSTGLQIEYAVVSVFLLLMVAILSSAVLNDKQRSIDVLEQYAKNLEQAIHDAKTDMMTGLYNHTEFYRVLQVAKDHSGRIVVAILDIDNFKKVNDTYGHDNGDKVIVRIAEVCRALGNGKDIYSFRYGGEEFAFIFFDMETSEANAHIEDIVRQVKNTRFDFNEGKPITMSAGLFGCDPRSYTVEEIFANADKALYYSKEHGRDQIHIY